MRCSGCQKEHKEGETRCTSCGADLKPARSSNRGRSRRKDPMAPLSPETEARVRAVWSAFRLSVYGLVPGLGLILGPLAFIKGSLARSRCLRDPEFTLWGPLFASICFGAVVTLCNWIGFTLMYLGLRSAGAL
jgi:hypothetical protein